MTCRIFVGSTGAGLWSSDDHGETWTIRNSFPGIYAGEFDIRALAVSPIDPRQVLVASQSEGPEDLLHRSLDGGDTFERLDVPLGGHQVWSVALSPHDRDVAIIGTCPAGLLLTTDGGMSWKELDADLAPECRIGATRMTALAFTPTRGEIWAGCEIDGVRHSTDLGATWRDVRLAGGEQLVGPGETWMDERHFDIHGLTPMVVDGKSAVAVTTPVGLFVSADLGSRWHATRYAVDAEADPLCFYSRAVMTAPDDPSVLFVGAGHRPPDHGTRGVLQRSDDGGRTWRRVAPVTRSVVWKLASHPRAASVMAAIAIYGQILLSADSGVTWQPVEREFGELRCVAVAPLGG